MLVFSRLLHLKLKGLHVAAAKSGAGFAQIIVLVFYPAAWLPCLNELNRAPLRAC